MKILYFDLIPNPHTRFVSWYAKRSGFPLGRSWAELEAAVLDEFLNASRFPHLPLRKDEGAVCSGSIGVCFDYTRMPPDHPRVGIAVYLTSEGKGFRVR